MTDSEIYYPMVYCEKCRCFCVPNKIKYCINPKSEMKKLDKKPLNKFNFNIIFDPDIKNANHDCKDYEEKT